MGLFKKSIDVKNPSKTTYSEDDLKKLDLNFTREFVVTRDYVVRSPFKKETPRALLTQIRDTAFDSVLDGRMFTFKHLLVIPNPYGVVTQSALLLFNTSEECKVRYRILGKTPENDFVGETELNTRHRVPILGLYKGYTNKLKLELINAQGEVIRRRDLSIYTRDIDLELLNIVTKVNHSEESAFPFLLVNGVKFNPIALDQNGEIRYAIQMNTGKMGMIPMQNGHFLFEDTSFKRVDHEGNIVGCQYQEMDYMGRIYHSFLLENPIGNAIAQNGDNLFLITSSSKEYEGDCIVEMDSNSGQVVKRLHLKDILGDKYQDRKKWAPVTYMEYHDGCLLLSLKRFHTVLKLRWEDGQVQWAMAPKSVWENTPVQKYLLNNTSKDSAVALMPEQCTYLEDTKEYLIHSVQNYGTIEVEEEKHLENSMVFIAKVDEGQKNFCYTKHFDTVKAKRFLGAIECKDKNRMLTLSGMLSQQKEDRAGIIAEIDTESGEVKNSFQLCKMFRRAWKFEPDIDSYSKPLEKNTDVIHGHLQPPAAFTGQLPPMTEEKLKKKVFSGARICDNLFLFTIYPGTVPRIYFIGAKHSYVQDYTSLATKPSKRTFAVSMDGMEVDEYDVYVEFKGEVYKLKNEIRIDKE